MKKKFIAFVNRRYIHSPGMPTCGTEELEAVDFDFCDPEVKASEIQRIFLRKIGSTDFTDWTAAEEWNERVSETDTTIDAIRALHVIGDKPLPNAPKKVISMGRTVTPRKEHTINFTIDEVTDANHAFVQSIGTGKRFKMNYETAGGYMFGGNEGITCEITLEMVLNRGAGETMAYQGTCTWVTTETEDRCTSPIFSETLLGSSSLDTTVTFASDATPVSGDCDFILAGGTNAVALFRFNQITPTVGTAIAMTVKISAVLALTANMTAEFVGQPFVFRSTAGVDYSGIIANGDVNF